MLLDSSPLARTAAIFRASASPQLGPRDRITTIGTVVHFSRNETIFNEGDESRFTYRVLSGAVRLCKVLPDGRRQIADFALTGDFFGLEAKPEHALTAEALGEVAVVRYSKKQLDQLSDEKPEFRNALIATLRQSLWSAQHHLIMLGRQTATERVVSFILQLSERANNAATIDLPMCRQDIADYLGLTIETVCRILTHLKKRRIIATPDRHTIIFKNRPALEALREQQDAA